jgi:PilZ domain
MGREQRKAKRRAVRLAGKIYSRHGEPIVDCEMRDISATGAQLALRQEIELPREFLLSLSLGGHVQRRCRKAWQFSILVGVKFADEAT